jgi:hypothetical protein
MTMLVKLEEESRELAASQRETDRRSLPRGSNRHTNN